MDSGYSSAAAVIILLLLLLLCASPTACEAAVLSLRRSHIRKLRDEGRPVVDVLESLLPKSFLLPTTIRLLLYVISFSIFFLSLTVWQAPLAHLLEAPGISPQFAGIVSFVIITLVVVLVVVLFGEIVPREIGSRHAETMLLWLGRPLYLLVMLLYPVSLGMTKIGRALARGGRDDTGTATLYVGEDELEDWMEVVEDEGFVIEEDEKKMIFSIFELSETAVREVMVPRIDVVGVEVNTPVRDALDVILKAGHSRIPVYRESIDNVVGLLYAKDILKHVDSSLDELKLEDMLREAYFVPDSKRVDDLLQELQQQRVHIAIVVDEYGGTAGLATIEDIVEEIVGEIRDEYDFYEEEAIKPVSEDELVCDARADIDDVNYAMDVDLPAVEYDTVGGLIYTELGRVPVKGDTLRVGDLLLTVLSVSGRRIGKVRIRKVSHKEGGGKGNVTTKGFEPGEKGDPAGIRG